MNNFTTVSLFKIPGCHIENIGISEDGKEAHLYIRHRRKTGNCPECQKRTRHVHAYQKQRRIFHRMLGRQRVYLVYTPRRFRCKHCGNIFTEQLPFLKKWKRQSSIAMSDSLFELKGQSFTSVVRKMGIGYARLRNYLFEAVSPYLVSWLSERFDEKIILGIDEHHVKDHKFVITVTNLVRREVKTILPSDAKACLVGFFNQLPEEIKEKITEVCCDMRRGFINAVYETLPNAKVVIDPFHVIQDANRRVNEVRKVEQEMVKKRLNWKILLKAKEHLNRKKDEHNLLAEYLKRYPYIRTFYVHKEWLRAIYKLERKEEAKQEITSLIAALRSSDLVELRRWGQTLARHKEEILNHWDSETTNAYTEGINVKMKMVQRMSFGFRNLDVYIRKATLAVLPMSWLLTHHTY